MGENCRWWFEEDGEYCKAAHKYCSCTGTRMECNYSDFFNVAPHRLPELRKKEGIERTIAKVEPYLGG